MVLSDAGVGGILTHVRVGLVSQEFHLPANPTSVAIGGGAVWIAAKGRYGSTVLRVSPRTGAVLARLRLRGAGDQGTVPPVVFGEGAVWVAPYDGTLFRIDPATARITGKTKLVQREVSSIAAGFGALWALVYDPDRGNVLVRIDPRTLRVTGRVPAPNVQSSGNELNGSLALGEGAVWWNGGDSGTVWRVDPAAARIDSTIRVKAPLSSFLDFEPYGIAAGAGGVWVTVRIRP